MPAKINLLNQTFGKLKVIEETTKRLNKSIVWKCQCECGEIIELSTKELRNDGIIQCRKCGLNREPKNNILENIIGKKFNHLTVLEKTNKKQSGKNLYKCECDCNNKTIIYINRTDLQNGHTKSCGCHRKKYNIGDIINNRKIIDFSRKNNDNRFYYKCKCLFCNREYEILAHTLSKTFSCGCQKSIGEYNILQILHENNISYIKEYCLKNSSLRFDFAILNDNGNIIRLIEFDGEQHYECNVKNSGWNTYEKYQNTLQNDLAKNQLAKENNIPLIRIPYWERDNINLEILFSNKYIV